MRKYRNNILYVPKSRYSVCGAPSTMKEYRGSYSADIVIKKDEAVYAVRVMKDLSLVVFRWYPNSGNESNVRTRDCLSYNIEELFTLEGLAE